MSWISFYKIILIFQIVIGTEEGYSLKHKIGPVISWIARLTVWHHLYFLKTFLKHSAHVVSSSKVLV